MKRPEVDHFVKSLDHPLKQVVERVRYVVLRADAGLDEGIKWNAPSFFVKRSATWFGTLNVHRRRHVRDSVLLILHQDARPQFPGARPTIVDPEGLVEWLGRDRCAVRFHDVAEFKARSGALREIVRQWVAQL